MFHWIGFFDYTVILTFLSLISAVLGTILSIKGKIGFCMLCLLACGLLDAFDGAVARTKKNRTEDEKSYGIQLDSLCDTVAFGIFPAIICYMMGMNGVVGIAILCLYCACAVTRLAFFNVMEIKRQKEEGGCNKYYRGLPVTSISMILPAFCLLRIPMPEQAFVIALHILMALIAVLFVLDFKVKKWIFRIPAQKKTEEEIKEEYAVS